MSNFQCGLAHAPVTPFKRDLSVDYDTYAKLIEFHLKSGAESIALPMPEGEDLSGEASTVQPEQRLGGGRALPRAG